MSIPSDGLDRALKAREESVLASALDGADSEINRDRPVT
jgi:hypothetical protein